MDRNVRKCTFWYMLPTKTQISLRNRTAWLESSSSTWRKFASLAIQNAPSEDSDQPARMRRLIWIFAGCTYPKLRFLTLRFNWFWGKCVKWVTSLNGTTLSCYSTAVCNIRTCTVDDANHSYHKKKKKKKKTNLFWGALHLKGNILHVQRKQLCQNCYYLPSEKRSTLKRKEFAPRWSKFFPFRVDLFFRRDLVGREVNRNA